MEGVEDVEEAAVTLVARTEFPTKATHAQTRAHNAGLVLRAVYDLGPISRAEIARLTGLTRTTVGELVSELEQEGLAQEVGRGPSTGGKAPTLVSLVDDARHVVSLDLGERTFTAALVDLRGEIRQRISTDLDGADGDAALAAGPRPGRRDPRPGPHQPILGIGVGTPGIVDGDGTIRWAVNLDWSDLPLGRILTERYGLPTIVANDTRAAALATFLFDGDDRARQPRRDQGRPRHRCRDRARRRAVRGRRRRRRRDRPHRRRARRRRVPLRPVRLPRDRGERAGDPRAPPDGGRPPATANASRRRSRRRGRRGRRRGARPSRRAAGRALGARGRQPDRHRSTSARSCSSAP